MINGISAYSSCTILLLLLQMVHVHASKLAFYTYPLKSTTYGNAEWQTTAGPSVKEIGPFDVKPSDQFECHPIHEFAVNPLSEKIHKDNEKREVVAAFDYVQDKSGQAPVAIVFWDINHRDCTGNPYNVVWLQSVPDKVQIFKLWAWDTNLLLKGKIFDDYWNEQELFVSQYDSKYESYALIYKLPDPRYQQILEWAYAMDAAELVEDFKFKTTSTNESPDWKRQLLRHTRTTYMYSYNDQEEDLRIWLQPTPDHPEIPPQIIESVFNYKPSDEENMFLKKLSELLSDESKLTDDQRELINQLKAALNLGRGHKDVERQVLTGARLPDPRENFEELPTLIFNRMARADLDPDSPTSVKTMQSKPIMRELGLTMGFSIYEPPAAAPVQTDEIASDSHSK